MMGRLNHDQRQLFYSFRLEDAVPDDHLVCSGPRVDFGSCRKELGAGISSPQHLSNRN